MASIFISTRHCENFLYQKVKLLDTKSQLWDESSKMKSYEKVEIMR